MPFILLLPTGNFVVQDGAALWSVIQSAQVIKNWWLCLHATAKDNCAKPESLMSLASLVYPDGHT